MEQTSLEILPPDTLLREKQILTMGIVPVCRVTLWRMVKDGRFPQPEYISKGVKGWRVHILRDWCQRDKSRHAPSEKND